MSALASSGAQPEYRIAGLLSFAGAVLMVVGAALWASTGTDIDAALVDGTMEAYLAEAAEHRELLIANLSLWILGVLVLGAAGSAMARIEGGPPLLHDLARLSYWSGAVLALSAFLAWLAIIVQGSPVPDPVEVAVAEVVGWYAYRADALATALIIGAGPAFAAFAGRRSWVPGWLLAWGVFAAAAGVISFVPYFVTAIPLAAAFLIVPIGIGWTFAAAVVLVRTAR